MINGFQRTLDHIRLIAGSEAEKGRLFERLMKIFFIRDPLYADRFSNVWLWSEWAEIRPEFDRRDIGIDLVAEERDGGFCAIQCKCYAPGTQISKPDLDSFVSASARDPFTARIVVDTGDGWGPNARKTIKGLKPSCGVMRFGDLASRPFDWPDLSCQQPEDLSWRGEAFSLHPHQREAFDDVIRGFGNDDRGKLVMACGAGKTFTALRIAESVAGVGRRVLYLVPSISLFQQSMREWATHRKVPHRYVGICSDTRAGRTDEDASIEELEIPVTTNPDAIQEALRGAGNDAMTVVFCTYQSLPLVERAQAQGAPGFDLAICDEAHRTTGVELPEDKASPFVLIHDAEKIAAEKRLYMTATPRIYAEGAIAKAAHRAAEVFSMDDEETFGPEFHRLPFSRAIEQNLLSDYKVVILVVREDAAAPALQAHLAEGDSEINLTDAAKIVGCWRVLQNPENTGETGPLGRAIAFNSRIADSQKLERYWDRVIAQAVELLPEEERPADFRCETWHVDGQHNALDRKRRIEWLKEGDRDTCRILTNARCLSEGIDVPALDAVLFMSPRNSQVDIVQAVGRAMRKAEGKEYGYIVLPVAVPPDVDPDRALDDNKRFAAIWGVLRALRSHDDRFDAEINRIDLNVRPTDRIRIWTGDGGLPEQELPFPPLDLPPGAIFAKVVEKCGDRRYWESWAKDVADIFARLVLRIGNLLNDPANEDLREWFDAFLGELKVSINEAITRAGAVDMMAQHILTQPVFEALFEHYEFAKSNPVAQALDSLRKDFGEFGLGNELEGLESFYESVRMRARGLDNSAARQHVLMELYEKFFATALKKEADKLGIVYTPVEVVDFILYSADCVSREEFGRSLSDEGVNVLDPFTGTGIFPVRLLQSTLVADVDLERKFHRELYANEIVLLAYYIAAVHIEEAFHGRRGAEYEPFDGIVLTDTFNLHTNRTGFPKEWLPDNSERVERQQNLPIQVVVGNPPWSVAQKDFYSELKQRVEDTYALRSNATLKSSLYDSYKMAIRWASDRIGEQGVVAFVTNGSWIDRNVDSGVRACLAEEFTSIYVLNLRGHQRTQGEYSRREGGKIFGQGSRAPVAITVLVRNPKANRDGCRILYRDVGDYLTREDKLAFLREKGSIAGIDDWKEIAPDRHHDWIDQRSDEFQSLYPLGSKDAKAGRTDETVFALFSNGYKTGRDVYVYNFSREACAENARKMVGDYTAALREWETSKGDAPGRIDGVARRYSANLRWDDKLKDSLRRKTVAAFLDAHIRKVAYRPFVAAWCYADDIFAQRPARTKSLFPDDTSENRAICATGVGSTKPFSALVVDTMPDLELISKGQCFPRYRYERRDETQGELLDGASGLERVDNIADVALRAFRMRYADNAIDKDDIFDYVYGVLHVPDWRERFANDLVKELPRVPFAPDFHALARAGRALVELHLGYEACEEYPLETVFTHPGEPRAEHFLIGDRAMRFDDDRTVLRINEHVSLRGIPPEAHGYMVNGRTPLEWLIDRYRIVCDKESGIVNDPNGWFDDPRELVAAIQRVVYVSVETVRIVAAFPELLADDQSGVALDFRAEAHRQSLVVARSAQAQEDQEFVDAISDWNHE